MQVGDLLITESQLNTRLNKSVHENRRGEFALLLAMLSHDALDFSQFHLPKSDAKYYQADEDTLRKQFGAGPIQPLAPDNFNMLIGQNNTELLAQMGSTAGMREIKLQHCLKPEPFNIRDDKNHIPLNIIDNCELAVRRRIKNRDIELANPSMDAVAFYDDLQNEALHQPLHLFSA